MFSLQTKGLRVPVPSVLRIRTRETDGPGHKGTVFGTESPVLSLTPRERLTPT